MALADFRHWESRQELKYQFDGFQNQEYRRTPSIQRYADILIGDSQIALPEMDVALLLPESHEGGEFPPDDQLAEAD